MHKVLDGPWAKEKWHVSLYNFVPEVRKQLGFADSIIISDCTLRDGEQQPGIVYSPEDKLKLALALDELGIHEIEVGMPSVSQGEQRAIKAIRKAGLKAKIRALLMAVASSRWCRAQVPVRRRGSIFPLSDIKVRSFS